MKPRVVWRDRDGEAEREWWEVRNGRDERAAVEGGRIRVAENSGIRVRIRGALYAGYDSSGSKMRNERERKQRNERETRKEGEGGEELDKVGIMVGGVGGVEKA
ncbi:hypothetical protein Sjap_024973 [Stephania japonica]|uniref:Uncharacterized protein n=1 Tax=Stephania japonica TaxID=461633 RepID=A0AAP0E472_9MAGN